MFETTLVSLFSSGSGVDEVPSAVYCLGFSSFTYLGLRRLHEDGPLGYEV